MIADIFIYGTTGLFIAALLYFLTGKPPRSFTPPDPFRGRYGAKPGAGNCEGGLPYLRSFPYQRASRAAASHER